jgi:hypothetical protein
MSKEIGRLAFRVEGKWWIAYYALPNTMEGAIVLGSIAMSLVEDKERKLAFQAIMKSAVEDLFAARFGDVIDSWNEQQAPESERSGSA